MSSAIKTPAFQAKAGSIQNQADTSAVYSDGEWSFKNSTAVASVTIKDDGKVGIGTDSPAAKFSVVGGSITTDASYQFTASSSTPASQAFIYRPVDYTLAFGTNGTERVRIHSNGSITMFSGLAIGTTLNPASSFRIGAGVLVSGAGSHYMKWNSTTGAVSYDTSSRLVKDKIEEIPYGLASVLSLQPRKYFRTDDQKEEIGFIADEVQSIIPEVVPMVQKVLFTKDEQDTELIPGGVNYDKLTAVLCKAIQEQQAQIEEMKAKIAALESK